MNTVLETLKIFNRLNVTPRLLIKCSTVSSTLQKTELNRINLGFWETAYLPLP